ncbi:Response regulator receiver domain-containing protein [Devosia sp. YR412]|uniref:response regulator n=1 Tax=Devosia sp. YR412 TaxID=1881030 RepID=UPI0008C57F4A|nr:response regulator [Devosia sp. YR412]SEP97116.1 Response regulator receiver domain-containing protein [Devosia sp. YR412]
MSVQPVALLVEDDALLVLQIEDEFTDAGFEIYSALHGTAAIAEIDSDPTQFFCLVTDIRLGTPIDGWAVARHARLKSPEIIVVYITGDSSAAWKTEGVPDSILLNKPLWPGQLSAVVIDLVNKRNQVA